MQLSTWPSRVAAAHELLHARGADLVPHPGGTLFDHLSRVRAQLAEWDAAPVVQLAGLCHAAYGTDGFPVALLEASERNALTEVIGTDAEALVYLYGSCDRGHVYPQLDQDAAEFLDRFTGARTAPGRTSLRAFAEITAANELDVVRHNPSIAAEHGPALRHLMTRARQHLSAGAQRAWAEQEDRARAAPGLRQ